MIIDTHTHVFPPALRDRRAALLAEEPAFAAIYSNADAAMATAGDVLASMDEAGVDRSVVANFAWRSEALIDETNEYILDAARRSGGRLLPFVSVHLAGGARHGGPEMEEAPAAPAADPRAKIRTLASAGARGIGELRPESSGYNLANSDEADVLAWAAAAFDLPLLIHASEPVGHAYPGKEGGPIAALYAFAKAAQGATVIAAHWGGGLPFYTLMPEVREALATMYFDSAASHLLYDPIVYRRVIDAVGVERVLFGSDFPLTSQARALERTRAAGLDPRELEAVLGANAARLLGP
ncbi:MAG TPA: amidohydrolase family protein [Dehalococcoidia bacterium]|nr:amidohydrolase family protein [Dehalococcoidia bacterium]